jgi:hypothetical protein
MREKRHRATASSRRLLARKLLGLAVLMMISGAFFGCAHPHTKETRSEAVIVEKNSGWKISRWYGHSGERTDELENGNVSVEIHFVREKGTQYFRVRFKFMEVSLPLTFSPSRITLRLRDGKTLGGKAVSCYKQHWDLESLRGYAPEAEPIHIDRVKKYTVAGNPCYSIFFDHPAPPVEDEIIMVMGDSFALNGIPMSIPSIHFRKNVHYSVWDELWDK